MCQVEFLQTFFVPMIGHIQVNVVPFVGTFNATMGSGDMIPVPTFNNPTTNPNSDWFMIYPIISSISCVPTATAAASCNAPNG